LINSSNSGNLQITSQGSANFAGNPSQEITISWLENLQLITPGIAVFFPNGTYTFTTSVTFRNEPFSPSQAL